jgi:hypothetical protein
VFDIASSQWRKPAIKGSITPRQNPAVAVFDKKIYVYGGTGPSGLLGDLYIFDTGI